MVSYDKIVYESAPIGSVATLAKTLDVSPSRLESIANNINPFYLVFEKQIGLKLRTLCDPNEELKRIQKKIVSRIFSHLTFPPYLHGGIKADDSRDFLSNAKAHSHAHIAIAIDVKDFFPSIGESLVEQAFKMLFRFPAEVSRILSKLTTLNGSVPQGAPTSTYVSNFVMFDREYRLVAALRPKGLRYSRLIDDITISSEKQIPQSVVTKVTTDIVNMLSAYGFKHHQKKYKVYTRSNPAELMMITGLWLNRGVPRIARKKREEISSLVVQLRKRSEVAGAREEADYHQSFNTLSGRVAVLQRIGHSEASRLRSILRDIKPIYGKYDLAKFRKIIPAFCRGATDRSKRGYIKKYYKFQYCVGIIKNSDPILARNLQEQLNRVRPTKTLRDLDEH